MGSSIVGSGAGTSYSQWQQTVDNTASTFSTGNVQPTSTDSRTFAQRVVVTCETAGLRVRWDGGTPTTTAGHIFTVGDTLILEGATNIANARFVRTGGVSGVIQVSAER